MRKLLWLAVFAMLVSWCDAQPTQVTFRYTSTDPSGACSNGTANRYNWTNNKEWGCNNGTWTQVNGSGGGGPPTGAAGGDLGGTYPNPSVVRINGTAFAGTTGHVVSFGASNTPADSGIVATALTQTIASGTSALGTSAIGSAACATAVTTSATGTATTDAIIVSFNADPTAVTGYIPSTSGMLTIIPYPTTNNVNFKVCNNTSSSITPGAITLNWRVVR